MSISAVDTVSSALGAGDTASRIPNRTLNQDDFLQLVVAQMTSQDPLNPMSDTEFISQMAQFSALEQSKSMQKDISILNANAVLGRVVALEDAQGALVQGEVSAIHMDAGTPKLLVNGQLYEMSALLSIEPTANP